jgi:hypothetical protein
MSMSRYQGVSVQPVSLVLVVVPLLGPVLVPVLVLVVVLLVFGSPVLVTGSLVSPLVVSLLVLVPSVPPLVAINSGGVSRKHAGASSRRRTSRPGAGIVTTCQGIADLRAGSSLS